MVFTDIISLSLIISFVLLITGIIFRKRAVWLSLFGSILLIITGIIMITNPVEVISGTQTIVNNSTYTTTMIYESQSSGLNTALSFVLLFVGSVGLFTSANILYNNRYEDD